MVGDGIHMVHFGGFIGSKFLPEDAGTAFGNLLQHNDGAWFFAFEDLSAVPQDPPLQHGDRADYRDAISAAIRDLGP